MAKDLVVVESPAKARTVGRFLGSGYQTLASMGHVRDLSDKKKKRGSRGVNGVEVDDEGFHPEYIVMPDKKKIVTQLRKASREADVVYLATDPDREGEAISWHLLEAAKIAKSKVKRVVFHEITKEAINEAFEHPRELDYNLIDAQQARRILDRLVGYRLSPVLWGKVKRGLSAGRVQSVALRLVVDREREINAFVPVEYWSIESTLAKKLLKGDKRIDFKAALHSLKGEKRIEISTGDRAHEIVADLDGAAYSVASVRKRETRRRPAAPFITSTMQQEASRKLRFTARRTMQVAQQLYEGISIGSEGEVGLITYMRTDSTNVASAALREANDYIKSKFGADFAPRAPRTYTRRVKGAQEAHEAIRPTSILRAPENIRQYLNNEQFRLYDLIWKRMLASQMTDALFDSTRVDIDAKSAKSANEYLFRASGSVMKFAGFRTLYMEGSDDNGAEDENTPPLPELADGDALDCRKISPEQHFTQPPPRYTDATLIRALEEQGIGRPSTYAPIISTIMDRDYVRKERGRFLPTKLGLVVTDFLTPNFPDVLSIGFTAKMEERLDDIADGELQWEPMLKDFYGPFDESIEKTMKEAERVPRESLEEETGEVCEQCGNEMVIKSGRYGPFIACRGYPECKNTKPVESPEERAIRELVSEDVDEFCEKCERPMAVRTGRNGRFLACTGYPECKNAKPLPVGVSCPDCGNDLVERKQKGRNGRIFYSCSNYPECKFAANPLPQPCPDCGKLLVTRGRGRKNARCLDDACGFMGPTPQEELEEAVA